MFLGAVMFVGAQEDEKELFLEAESRFRNKNYEFALESYSRLLREYPLSRYVPDAQFRRAVSMYRLERYAEALSLFNTIENRYTSTRFYAYVPFWKGVIHFKQHNYQESVKSLSTFLTEKDKTEIKIDTSIIRKAYLYKGLSEENLSKIEEARNTFKEMVREIDTPSSEPFAVANYIALSVKTGNYQDALDLFTELNMENFKGNWGERIRFYAAEAFWHKKNYEKAEELYKSLTDASSEVASRAFQRRFLIAQMQGESEKLTKILTEAEVALAGQTETLKDFWLQVGIESFKQEKISLAESYFQRVWNLRENTDVSSTAPLYLAEISASRGEYERGLSVLTEYLSDNNSDSALARFKLGEIAVKAEEFDRAIEALSKLLEKQPDTKYYSEAGYLYAYALYKNSNFKKALNHIESMQNSGKTGSYSAQLFKLQANIHQKQNNSVGAIKSYQSYIPLRPQDVKARVEYIKLLFVEKRYEKLISEVNNAISDIPTMQTKNQESYIQLQYFLGLSHISKKNYNEAIEVFTSVADKARENPQLSSIAPYIDYYHGWALYKKSNYQSAISAFTKVTPVPGDKNLAHRASYRAAWCAYSSQAYQKAKELLLPLLDVSDLEAEFSAKSQFLYGQTLTELKNNEEAAVAFQNLHKNMPDSEFADNALYEYAEVLARLERYEKSAETYYALVQEYPNSPLAEDSMYKRAEVLREGDLFAEARDAYYEYRVRFPNGSLVDAALYWGGVASRNVDEPFRTVLLWEKLIEEYSDSTFRSDALHKTAEIYAENGQYEKALNMYTKLISSYPQEAKAVNAQRRAEELRYLVLGLSDREAELSVAIGQEGGASTEKGRQAMLKLAKMYIYEDEKIDLALSMLRDVIKKKDQAPKTAAQAQYTMGEYYYRQDNYPKAGDAFLEAALMYPDDKDFMAESLFQAAKMKKLAGSIQAAEQLVTRLEENFPSSQWAKEGRNLLEETE